MRKASASAGSDQARDGRVSHSTCAGRSPAIRATHVGDRRHDPGGQAGQAADIWIDALQQISKSKEQGVARGPAPRVRGAGTAAGRYAAAPDRGDARSTRACSASSSRTPGATPCPALASTFRRNSRPRRWPGWTRRCVTPMPTCPDDGYPMVPVREIGRGQMKWACTNPWHPHDPGPCPQCGNPERPRASATGANPEARCRICGHQWLPLGT